MSYNYLSFSCVSWKGKILEIPLWKSLKNPSLREDLERLGEGKNYDQNIFELEMVLNNEKHNNKNVSLIKKRKHEKFKKVIR